METLKEDRLARCLAAQRAEGPEHLFRGGNDFPSERLEDLERRLLYELVFREPVRRHAPVPRFRISS